MQFTQDQWDKLIADYPPGTFVSGTVRACKPFGDFVLLDDLPNVPCLLEIIHFAVNETSPEHSVRFPADYPSVGDRISARILAWSVKTHDVRLTQLSNLNWIAPKAAESGSGN